MTTANIHLLVLLIVFLCTFGGALVGLMLRSSYRRIISTNTPRAP